MGGVPYALPGTMPPAGVPGWHTSLNANLADIQARTNLHEAAYGAPLDAFAGTTDDARLDAAMAYAAAQTRPPAILLSNRAYAFSGPREYYNGFKLVGSLGTREREFGSTGPHTVVTASSTAGVPSLFKVPAAGVKNVWISGIQFRSASGGVHFQEPVTDLGSGPVTSDATFVNLAWVGFASVMQARHLRVCIDCTYTNNGTDTQYKLAGSDNYYWLNGGYLSSTRLGATKFYLWFTHMSRSHLGPLYITPEKATGIRIDGSYGGFNLVGTLLDCSGRNADTACQGSAVLVTGGRGYVFDRLWLFNNCVRPASTSRVPRDKGQVFLRGSTSEVLFQSCQFLGGDVQRTYTPAGTPAIYAAAGVSAVKVVAPIAPAGGTRLLHQQTAGIISKFAADDWSLAVA